MRAVSCLIFVVAAVLALGPTAARAEPPKRVVSMNLCTDQLAMLLAGGGQLFSVSWLAADERSSVLAAKARGLRLNHGLAEEIFLMQPDLVIAGTYTTRATLDLLRRLGIRVEEFPPESSIDDVRANINRMGALLGRKAKAQEVVQAIDAELAAVAQRGATGQTVATYYPNGFSSGAGTLVDTILKAAGLTNVADQLGLTGTARLPLETLIMAQPDLIASDGDRYGTPSLAEDVYRHPAYEFLLQRSHGLSVPSKYTICGGPFTAQAAVLLRDLADQAKPHR